MSERTKMPKEKRQRSASSVGSILQENRSDRKIELRRAKASIPEADDKFSVAEARCNDLKEKIDLVKTLKHKKKLKKRSTTLLAEHRQSSKDEIPMIAVRTQPKRDNSARTRRYDGGSRNSRKSYDPASQEQYRMLKEMRVYNRDTSPPPLKTKAVSNVDLKPISPIVRRRNSRNSRADGDSARSSMVAVTALAQSRYMEEAAGASDISELDDRHTEISKSIDPRKLRARHEPLRRRRIHQERPPRLFDSTSWIEETADTEIKYNADAGGANTHKIRRGHKKANEEKPVVELYNKESILGQRGDMMQRPPCRMSNTDHTSWKRTESHQVFTEKEIQPLDNITTSESKTFKSLSRHPSARRPRYRTRRYEFPTFASQMKQAGIRYAHSSSRTNIPFVVSQSTSPSHNIGLNIQQVLNGIKVQQPLSGIPITIAHHMGLRHVPFWIGPASMDMEPELDNRQINVIKLGRKLLRLPSYKFISYNRLLKLYREGEGLVPRFLRAMSRPHYSYTSMYSLPVTKDDHDGSKGEGPKQSLAAYAALYREYERVSRCIQDGNCEPEMLRRKEELSRELTAREGQIRKLVHEYRTSLDDTTPLRTCASTNDEVYRRSSYKTVQ